MDVKIQTWLLNIKAPARKWRLSASMIGFWVNKL